MSTLALLHSCNHVVDIPRIFYTVMARIQQQQKQQQQQQQLGGDGAQYQGEE